MTRINTSVKGRNHELEDKNHCISMGFTIYFRSVRTKFQRIDYGPFDIVGNKRRGDSTPPQNYYISSKSNGHYNKQHVEEITAWMFERAHEWDTIELRDHVDGMWKFGHVDCKHKAGCKYEKKKWSRTPSRQTCPKCKRKLRIVKNFIPPIVRVTGFTLREIKTWDEKVLV